MSTMPIITSLKSSTTQTTPTQCVILRTPFANTNTYCLSTHNIRSKQLHNFKRKCVIATSCRFVEFPQFTFKLFLDTQFDKYGFRQTPWITRPKLTGKLHVTDTWRSECKIREMCGCHCFCQLPKDVPQR